MDQGKGMLAQMGAGLGVGAKALGLEMDMKNGRAPMPMDNENRNNYIGSMAGFGTRTGAGSRMVDNSDLTRFGKHGRSQVDLLGKQAGLDL